MNEGDIITDNQGTPFRISYLNNAVTLSIPPPLVDLNTGAPDADHPGLRLWLDAADSNTLWQDTAGTQPATTGQAVARWDDKSSIGINVIQSNLANQPVYAAAVSGLGNQPAVQFTGGANGTVLTAPGGNTTGLTGASPLTLVTIWQNTGYTGQNYQHTFHMGTSQPSMAYGHSTSRSANAGSPIGNHYWSSGFDTTGPATAANTPFMAVSTYDGTVDSWYINGTPAGNNTVSFNIGMSELQIGSRINHLPNITEGFTGDLAEVMLFDRPLTTDERNALGGYVYEKYRFTISGATGANGFRAYIRKNPSGGPNEFIISWDSRVGEHYRIEYSSTLTGSFTPLAINIPGVDGATEFPITIEDGGYLRVGRE